MSNNPKFMRLAWEREVIDREEAGRLEREFEGDAFAVLQHMVAENYAPRDELGSLWGDSLQASFVDLGKTLFQKNVVSLLPKKEAKKYNVILLYRFGDVVTAATPNPKNHLVARKIEQITGERVSMVFAFPDEVANAIEIEYESAESLDQMAGEIRLGNLFQKQEQVTFEMLKELAGNEAVIEFTRSLLLFGIKERASDIHIDPIEQEIKIRLRIDGILQNKLRLNKKVLPPLVSRIKIMAGLDITERRKPQDGRLNLHMTGKSVDFRVATVPAMFGEKITLRILGELGTKSVPEIKELNFSKSVYDDLEKIIETPNGIFFVTGPTGSGKTTTLYAVLKRLNKPDVNIMTIEDPIEYRLSGINQVQVNTAIDLGFSRVLRSFLRHDPDVILVGEIRDCETAKVASQAALTGHLVMATMHTNNSIQAVTRLIEIGVEPFLVAPSIIGVLAQRLVRRICKHCKEEYLLPREQAKKLFLDTDKEVRFYRGRGCTECNNTGYLGRMGIHELLIINEAMRTMIAKGASILDIRQHAANSGFKSMHYDGIKKVLRGLTTVDEVNRVTCT